MDFEQSKYTNKTSFKFASDGFAYVIKDRSGTRNNFIRYIDVSLSQRYEIEEKSEYLRNVGFLWLILGVVFTVMTHAISFWIYIGGICLAIYYFISVKYTVIPSSQGNILVIQSPTHDAILNELTERVKRAVLEEYGTIDYNRLFEEERRKYKSLLDNQIIGESQFNEYCATMEENRDKFKKDNAS